MAKKTAPKKAPTPRKSAIAVDLQTGLRTEVAIGHVHPDPNQPRTTFDAKALEVLAANVKARGIYQPILVRYVDGKVTIVDGERRWRAAKIAKLKTVPVLLVDTGTYDDEVLQADQVGLNQLGERLRPMEVARTLRRWRDAGKTPNEIAKMLADMGHPPMKPAAVEELADLTFLPAWAQSMIDRDELAAGPAALVVEAIAIPGVEKLLRKALEQDVGYRGTLTARDVKVRVSDALRNIGKNLGNTESWYGNDAVHFDWKTRCRNCEHLVKWDGTGYCLNAKLFAEHQAEAKAAGLGPGGKRPEKPRDAAGRITSPEKAEAEAAELKHALRERSLTEKARDYLHAHLCVALIEELPKQPALQVALSVWRALKSPGSDGSKGAGPVDAAIPTSYQSIEQIAGEMTPSQLQTAALDASLNIVNELPWREVHALSRLLWGNDLHTVWTPALQFLDLMRKAELAHLAKVHQLEIPEGRRSWDALKGDEIKAAFMAQPDKWLRPALLADLYQAEVDKPYRAGSWKGRNVVGDDEEDETVCIGCGCTHTDPCEEGCGWAAIEDFDETTERYVSVCDSPACASHLERFEAGDFTLSEAAALRVNERHALRPLGHGPDEDGELEDAA